MKYLPDGYAPNLHTHIGYCNQLRGVTLTPLAQIELAESQRHIWELLKGLGEAVVEQSATEVAYSVGESIDQQIGAIAATLANNDFSPQKPFGFRKLS